MKTSKGRSRKRSSSRRRPPVRRPTGFLAEVLRRAAQEATDLEVRQWFNALARYGE